MMARANLWLILACLWSCAALAADPADARLVATETVDRVELTVPVSKLVFSFPKGNLSAVSEERTGAQAHPRYFHYADPGAEGALVVSGWIESTGAFQGFKEFWIGELEGMKDSGFPPATPPAAIEAGEWVGIAYEVKLPGAPDATNTHIRAELLRAGTWIDLHISLTSRDSATGAREKLMQFLKSITVWEKGAGAPQNSTPVQ